jgi:hypothetical protein
VFVTRHGVSIDNWTEHLRYVTTNSNNTFISLHNLQITIAHT